MSAEEFAKQVRDEAEDLTKQDIQYTESLLIVDWDFEPMVEVFFG